MKAGSGSPPARIVSCPSCGAPVAWTAENRYRPFCSARCKGNDLGAWASDQYRVAARDEAEPGDAPVE